MALIFGTKKLRNIGSDLGGAVKGFKDSVSHEPEKDAGADESANAEHHSEKDEQKD